MQGGDNLAVLRERQSLHPLPNVNRSAIACLLETLGQSRLANNIDQLAKAADSGIAARNASHRGDAANGLPRYQGHEVDVVSSARHSGALANDIESVPARRSKATLYASTQDGRKRACRNL